MVPADQADQQACQRRQDLAEVNPAPVWAPLILESEPRNHWRHAEARELPEQPAGSAKRQGGMAVGITACGAPSTGWNVQESVTSNFPSKCPRTV